MRHRWPPLLATGLVLIAAAILIAAYTAAATNVTVSASAKCIDSDTGRYDVTATAHNTYSQTLHVRVDNPNSPIPVTLAPNGQPGDSWSFTFHVDHYQPWTVKFTSSDGILVGQTVYNFTFQGVCGTPPPPPATTSSTTCDRANPPRTDCDTTTIPSTTAPSQSTTTVTTSPASVTSPTTGPPVSTALPGTGAAGHPTTVTRQLPVTGPGDVVAFLLAGLACLIAGGVLYTVRRRPS